MAYQVTLINFPRRDEAADVRTFATIRKAELFARKLQGVVYIFGRVTARGLMALTLSELNTIYNQGHSEFEEPVHLKHRRDLAERCAHIIQILARPAGRHARTRSRTMSDAATNNAETKSTKKAAKKAPAKKKAAKKAPEQKAETSERVSPFAGKKLIKTEKGETIRRKANSRRTVSYNAFKSGVLYETALKNGAHQDDIAIMVRDGQITVE